MEKTAKKFRSFAEAEKADRVFYKKLTGNDERLRILVQLLNQLELLYSPASAALVVKKHLQAKFWQHSVGSVFVFSKHVWVETSAQSLGKQDLADTDMLED